MTSTPRIRTNRHLPISDYITDSPETYFILSNDTHNLPIKVTTHVIPLGPAYDSDRTGQPQFVPDKYWSQRYSLFARYDQGILMDSESWYSVTHEAIAQQIASTCSHLPYVLDAFAGVGGNAIQFAQYSRVVAIEIDKKKADYLRKNAKVYEVQEKIKVVRGDFFEKAESVGPVDLIFLSPPWGGPDYQESDVFVMLDMVSPALSSTLSLCSTLTSSVFLYMPRNIDPMELLNLFDHLPGIPQQAEIHLYFFGNKVKTIGILLGKAVNFDLIPLAEAIIGQNVQSKRIKRLYRELGNEEMTLKIALCGVMEREGVEETLKM